MFLDIGLIFNDIQDIFQYRKPQPKDFFYLSQKSIQTKNEALQIIAT
jgi:hypothetical protein